MSNYVTPSVTNAHSPKCGCGSCTQGLRGFDFNAAQTVILNSLKFMGVDVASMVNNVVFSSQELQDIRNLSPGQDLTGQYKTEVNAQIQGAIPGILSSVQRNPFSAAQAVNNSINAAKGAAKAKMQQLAASVQSSGGGGGGSSAGLPIPLLVGGAAVAGLAAWFLLLKKKV